jgi:carbamoyl-phosphate synthase large subunit
MKIVINKQELEEHVVNLLKTIPGNKLLLDHYLDGAIEAEADAICDENVYIIGIMEHIEPCGVHSEIVMQPAIQSRRICNAANKGSY